MNNHKNNNQDTEQVRFNTFFRILFDLSYIHAQRITSIRFIQLFLSLIQILYIYPRCLIDFFIFSRNANDHEDHFFKDFIEPLKPVAAPSLSDQKISTIFISTFDYNGYVHGFLGQLQILYDQYRLVKNGYRVNIETLSNDDNTLLTAMQNSSVIIFRGHGSCTSHSLLNFIKKFKDLAPDIQNTIGQCEKTIVFESCSTAQYFQQYVINHSLDSVMQQCQIRCVFAPAKDITASKLHFDDHQKLQSVDYIPYLGFGLSNILYGRTMTPTYPSKSVFNSI